MNKSAIYVGAALVIAIFIGFYYYTDSNRYYMQMSGNVAFKIDRKTGQSWVIYSTGVEKPVNGALNQDSDNNSPEKAIEMAKKHKLTESYTAEDAFKKVMETKAGVIYGWKAEKVDEQGRIINENSSWRDWEPSDSYIYLVSFTFQENGVAGYYFEVQPSFGVVRFITDETLDLLSKYGLEGKKILKKTS